MDNQDANASILLERLVISMNNLQERIVALETKEERGLLPPTPLTINGDVFIENGDLEVPSGYIQSQNGYNTPGNIAGGSLDITGPVRFGQDSANEVLRRNAMLTANPMTDFNETSLPTGWSWVSGGTFGVPNNVTIADSWVGAGGLGGGRAFLQQTTIPGAGLHNAACLSVSSLITGYFVGIRMDNGGDNNYEELGIRINNNFPSRIAFEQRSRQGGGTETVTTTATEWFNLSSIIILNEITGTRWSNWNSRVRAQLPYGRGALWMTNNVTGRNWTPTRVGITWRSNGSTETFRGGFVDWFAQVGIP